MHLVLPICSLPSLLRLQVLILVRQTHLRLLRIAHYFLFLLSMLITGSTLRNYVAGVKAWHIVHRIEWRICEDEISRLLKAADNLAPPSAIRLKREPFTPNHIEAIRQRLDLTIPMDAAVYACLAVVFYACISLGEFTTSSKAAFDSARHVSRSSLRTEKDRKGNEVVVIFLPRTRTAPRGEDVAFAAQAGPTDPLTALNIHLTVNNPAPNDHLFAYKDKSGILVPLTRSKFLDRIEIAAKAANLPKLRGHSIRIGSTLEYLLRGVPLEAVKQLGRWKSEAFTRYLRKHAQILAPYLQTAPPTIQAAFSHFVA